MHISVDKKWGDTTFFSGQDSSTEVTYPHGGKFIGYYMFWEANHSFKI